MSAWVLLLQDSEGGPMAIPFQSQDDMQQWQDDHDDEILTAGSARMVSASEALEESRRALEVFARKYQAAPQRGPLSRRPL